MTLIDISLQEITLFYQWFEIHLLIEDIYNCKCAYNFKKSWLCYSWPPIMAPSGRDII